MNHIKTIIVTVVLLFSTAHYSFAGVPVRFPSYQSYEPFEDVIENVKDAIIGRGLNISNTLPASEMLNRTGKDFGHINNVFINAQTIEFCSAKISHQLVKINPNNIVLCPFTISVYQLTVDPDTVYIAYRTPLAGVRSRTIVAKVETLIQNIIQEALQ